MTEDSKLRSIESDLHKLEEQAKHDKREFEVIIWATQDHLGKEIRRPEQSGEDTGA